MEETESAALCCQLDTVDRSLGFFLLVIASVLLSFWSVCLQREGLCRVIRGDTQGAAALPPVFPIKIGSSALLIGSLGFYLCLALHTLRRAEGGEDCVAKKSARTGALSATLVLAAALLRLDDLVFVEGSQPALAEADIQPE